MADTKYDSEKVQEENIETTPGQEVSTLSSPDGAVAAAQGDDLPETLSVSTIMAIFVSSGLLSVNLLTKLLF